MRTTLTICFLALVTGCNAAGNALSLGGYRGVKIASVTVTGDMPFAQEKLQEKIQADLELRVRHGMYWSLDEKPSAVVDVEIDDFKDTSKATRVLLGAPPSVAYRIVAKDAASGAFLGEARGRVAARMVTGTGGNIITGGLTAVAINLQMENATPESGDAFWLVSGVVTQIQEELLKAKKRMPRRRTRTSVAEAGGGVPPPDLSPSPSVDQSR